MVVVPNISLPIFIPEVNSSFIDRCGLLVCTSYRAEEMAIDVSIIFPIKPIITIQWDSVNISIPALYMT